MAWLRSVAIVALWVTLFAGSAYAVVERKEPWPFSQYAMYTGAGKRTVVDWPQVEGIKADGSRVKLSIREHLAPFDPSRLEGFLNRVGKGKKGKARKELALERLLAAYEHNRREGRHDGPPLVGLDIYDASWTIRPDLSNRDRPEKRKLLGRIAPPEAK